MNETQKQLDKLVAVLLSYITGALELIPTWLSMLKSTRVLTIIGTVILMYITWKYGGLTDTQMLVVNGIEGLLGVSFMGFKTLRSSTALTLPAVTTLPAGTSSQPPSQPGAAAQPTAASPPIKYLEPFDPKLSFTNGPTAYLRWEQFEDLLTNMDLTRFHPDIRLDLASQVVEENLSRLSSAWNEASSAVKAVESIPAPLATDFDSYDATENYKKMVRDKIPGCLWLNETMVSIIIGYGVAYDSLAKIGMLKGKQVNWKLVNTIDDIRREGLKAVGG